MTVRQCFHVVLGGFFVLLQLTLSEASCYFSQQYQGEYVMQNSANIGSGIQYSQLTINVNSISIWGNCHKRTNNNNVILINYGDTSCYTCLHLKLRSPNVLQVFAASQEIMSKCFTNEETAEANCPSEESLEIRGATAEILLFKVKDDQGAATQKQYCPIDGKYYATYKGKNLYRQQECIGFNSTVNSCPSGSTLNFRLRSCTFDSYDLRFDCLGHWKAPKGETFLVFTDSRHLDGQKPKYRCALYKQDRTTGKLEMAVSRDSTCISDLYNSTNGFETFVLASKTENPWPAEVNMGVCSFPKWMFGSWEYVRVEGDTMVYKDHTSFKTYTIKCAGTQDSNKYLIFSRTQCDEESFNCMRVANRSRHVLEFQLGTNSSHAKDYYNLCAETNFDDNSWVTQGRIDIIPSMQNGLCPINGEYTGRIPDAPDLCAKLWSDCRAPELMYYQVSDCKTQEIYEEREYQCLGHWREQDLLYTYTERRDVADGTYECFVGSIITDKEIFIKEAGEHCQRNIDPLKYGMKLLKTKPIYSCADENSKKPYPMPSIPPRFSTISPRRTTNKYIESNAIPELPAQSRSSPTQNISIVLFNIALLYWILRQI